MPSLHAGVAMLVTLFFWPAAGTRWRVALLLYAISMALALVYTGEHYVVEVLAGWLMAGLAFAVACELRRPPSSRRREHRSRRQCRRPRRPPLTRARLRAAAVTVSDR